MTLATLIQGHTSGADLCFLIAVILFVVLAVIAVTRQAVESAISNTGFALIALGLLIL